MTNKQKPKQGVELGFAILKEKDKICRDRRDSKRKFPCEAEEGDPQPISKARAHLTI